MKAGKNDDSLRVWNANPFCWSDEKVLGFKKLSQQSTLSSSAFRIVIVEGPEEIPKLDYQTYTFIKRQKYIATDYSCIVLRWRLSTFIEYSHTLIMIPAPSLYMVVNLLSLANAQKSDGNAITPPPPSPSSLRRLGVICAS